MIQEEALAKAVRQQLVWAVGTRSPEDVTVSLSEGEKAADGRSTLRVRAVVQGTRDTGVLLEQVAPTHIGDTINLLPGIREKKHDKMKYTHVQILEVGPENPVPADSEGPEPSPAREDEAPTRTVHLPSHAQRDEIPEEGYVEDAPDEPDAASRGDGETAVQAETGEEPLSSVSHELEAPGPREALQPLESRSETVLRDPSTRQRRALSAPQDEWERVLKDPHVRALVAELSRREHPGLVDGASLADLGAPGPLDLAGARGLRAGLVTHGSAGFDAASVAPTFGREEEDSHEGQLSPRYTESDAVQSDAAAADRAAPSASAAGPRTPFGKPRRAPKPGPAYEFTAERLAVERKAAEAAEAERLAVEQAEARRAAEMAAREEEEERAKNEARLQFEERQARASWSKLLYHLRIAAAPGESSKADVYAQTSRAVRASLREYQERMASAGLPMYGNGAGSEVPRLPISVEWRPVNAAQRSSPAETAAKSAAKEQSGTAGLPKEKKAEA